jgi:hypothetical protein
MRRAMTPICEEQQHSKKIIATCEENNNYM